MTLAKSPLGRGIESGVLTFHQAMSGAVSPQYAGVVTGVGAGAGVGSGASSELDKCRLGSSSALAAVAEHTAESAAATPSGGPNAAGSTTAGSSDEVHSPVANSRALQQQYHSVNSNSNSNQQRERGVGESSASVAYGSSATIAVAVHMAERQRLRTSSMPAESRKVSMLRGAITEVLH